MNIFLAINIKNFQESQNNKNDDDEESEESQEQSDSSSKPGVVKRSQTFMGGFQRKITRIMSSRSARDYEEEDDYIKRSRSEHVEGFNNLEIDIPGQDLSVKP